MSMRKPSAAEITGVIRARTRTARNPLMVHLQLRAFDCMIRRKQLPVDHIEHRTLFFLRWLWRNGLSTCIAQAQEQIVGIRSVRQCSLSRDYALTDQLLDDSIECLHAF